MNAPPMLASPMTVPTMPALPLRALVLAIVAIVIVPLASAGCPHQGHELQVVAPLSTTDEDADRLLREADRAADEGRPAHRRAPRHRPESPPAWRW